MVSNKRSQALGQRTRSIGPTAAVSQGSTARLATRRSPNAGPLNGP